MTAPRFDHVLALSDRVGTFEHADGTTVRREHGYCVDDVARVLVAVLREPHPTDAVVGLASTSWDFLSAAQADDGRIVNRCSADGTWSRFPSTGDCWGRWLWAVGTLVGVSGLGSREDSYDDALARFELSARRHSTSPRAMAYACLGAVDVLAVAPDNRVAQAFVEDTVELLFDPDPDVDWPWPEERLAYANALIPDALIAAGRALDRTEVVDAGLGLLGWLAARETHSDHLSPTPVGGSGPLDATGAMFDQQPIEVSSLADAAMRAYRVTNDPHWRDVMEMAVGWFHGANDVGVVMYDPESGGGFDGLHERGPNTNQGAESTLALITTMQHARTLVAH